MAKPGLTVNNCGGCLRSTANSTGWALCVGAGVSMPIFPAWGGLVRKLLEWSEGNDLTDQAFNNLKSGFSLDALIQAVHGKSGLPEYQFAQVLSKLLFDGLRSQCTTREWRLVTQFFRNKNHHDFTASECEDLLSFFHSKFGNCSALQLAEILGRSVVERIPPASIVSFNAEPLLQTLAAAYIRVNTQLPRRRYFDSCIRGLTAKTQGRIGVYYCHGLLPLPGEKVRKTGSSIEKLVFSETEYLALAGTTFSWQSAVFLNAAMSHSMVFVGVSFSDPNLRRWLGFVHANRIKELRALGEKVTDSTRHYWIQKTPATDEERRWVERVVAHLGVRLIWIEGWWQVRDALTHMLSL